MSASWILRRLANVSPFFNSLSNTNRVRITNYCLRSVSSSLLKFTRFIQRNNIAWTNLDMIGNLHVQHFHMNKKSYTYKTWIFNSHWILLNHYRLLMANVLQWKHGPMLICRLWWGWSHNVVGHLFWNA
jgi:hypothetical protein